MVQLALVLQVHHPLSDGNQRRGPGQCIRRCLLVKQLFLHGQKTCHTIPSLEEFTRNHVRVHSVQYYTPALAVSALLNTTDRSILFNMSGHDSEFRI